MQHLFHVQLTIALEQMLLYGLTNTATHIPFFASAEINVYALLTTDASECVCNMYTHFSVPPAALSTVIKSPSLLHCRASLTTYLNAACLCSTYSAFLTRLPVFPKQMSSLQLVSSKDWLCSQTAPIC